MTKPCKNCPFRTDSLEGWLGNNRASEISNSLTVEDKTFPCHKTVDYDSQDDDEAFSGVLTNETQHCAGALIMLEKMNKPNQMMRIAERLGLYNRTKLKMDSPIFNNSKQFIIHHSKTK